MGSTSLSRVRLGSALEIIARAEISSPVLRTTLVAVPSLTRISMTSTPVRISAPAACADLAIACVMAPAPPWASQAEPAGWGSLAARSSRTSVLPADHGPSDVPKTPRAATVARSRSVSNHSLTKSAAAMGPQRRSRYISFLPKPLSALPVFSSAQRSLEPGRSMSGGVSARACCKTLPSFSRVARSSVYFAASFSENFAISWAARWASL